MRRERLQRSGGCTAGAACFSLWLGTAAAFAQPSGEALATQGSGAVPACASCHGKNGEGMPGAGFPRLAGQGRAYLAKQLEDFKSGRRKAR